MDELIDEAAVVSLTDKLKSLGAETHHLALAPPALLGKKLRARVDIVRDALLADLPRTYVSTSALMRQALDDPSLSGWMIWPVSEAVVGRALDGDKVDDFDDAMDLLTILTTRLTGEFAIRAMLNTRFDRSLSIIRTWTDHSDEQVRRLASEGTRSHLPWAKGVPQLVRQPGRTSDIVNNLYRDESEFVRRSVANHVNDMSRDNPDTAAALVRDWLDQPDQTTASVARRALRTLIKNGHSGSLEMMGFTGSDFDVDGPYILTREIEIGSAVQFKATITNRDDVTARAAIDFVMHFKNSQGTTRPKVFKIGVRSIEPGETAAIEKSYSFKPQNTRAFHVGEHAIELQVNGRPYGRATFKLVDDLESSHV